jgi:hypothetical protein
MPEGKKAGERCAQLTPDNRCMLFGKPGRPAVCIEFKPSLEMCGENNEHAFRYLGLLEEETKP